MDINYTIFPLIGCVATLLFMLFVLVYRPRTMANLLFLMFCLTAAIWLFGTYKMFTIITDGGIIFWDHFVYIGVTLMSIFLYHFGVVYLRQIESRCHGVAKSQLSYVLAGLAFFVIVGPFAYLPAYQVPTFPIVFVAVIPFVALLFHAMFKYEFLSDFDELFIRSEAVGK